MGYKVMLATQSGGKAGKGRNKTSTVQVLCDNILVKSFRFRTDNMDSFKRAKAKAMQYVEMKEKPPCRR